MADTGKTLQPSGRVKVQGGRIRESLGERIFTVLNYVFFILLGMATLFPFLNIIAKSFSGEAAVVSGLVTIYPIDFQTGTYQLVLGNKQFINSFKITIIVTIIGTLSAMLMTVLAAYPLSKPHLVGRKAFLLIYVFTMLFNGGLIPTYLLMQNLGLVNTMWALFLPTMIVVFNMLIVKNYFEALPESLEESAKLDGASTGRILFSIILPLSKPVLATVGLFYAVALWNSYFAAMVYITAPELKPLQLYLKELIASTNEVMTQAGEIDVSRELNKTPEAVQAASIITATVPILCVYPFLQKYFVKGVLVGSVKG
ncbi:Inner membrane ABC transporter permease protein ycjP [Chlamydia abortus]|jgi:putative aldouronate transport system permease protein|uniref:Carbohydrate ABC transporter permease n=1 Tax=Paenibacillus residui TaxID=629724 RepID=A0ABW3D7Y5_9BACL|nr:MULTISPECIES: carbohydrate ABC transporter permease [Paenibacillaceae]SHE15000.1 Inner membrane ABC transporter permease protein ycjP [Chlamydia abortus]